MSENPLRLRKIHHVEMWVGNAKQAAYFYRKAFGFRQIAYAGLETGRRDVCSFAMEQGQAKLVLTSSFDPDSEISRHVTLHGDGVKDICFHVDDTDRTFAEVLERGAEAVAEPYDMQDEHGTVRRATIATYGETVHSLISDKNYNGPFLPGFQEEIVETEDAGLLRFDHMVGNVELGKMEHWATWYSNVLGFNRYIQFDDSQISTEYSALMSIVMSDNSYSIKFPINEPAQGRNKSQIEEYLDFYRGPGVQHIAMLTSDIVKTVTRLMENGVKFIEVPDAYYENLPERVGEIDESIRDLQPLASWRIATTKVTCYSSSPSRWWIGRPSSSRSFSARAAVALVRATSRPCSRPSSASKRGAAISEHKTTQSARRRIA